MKGLRTERRFVPKYEGIGALCAFESQLFFVKIFYKFIKILRFFDVNQNDTSDDARHNTLSLPS